MNHFKQELNQAEEELRRWQNIAQSHPTSCDNKEYQRAVEKLCHAKKQREMARFLYTYSFSIPTN